MRQQLTLGLLPRSFWPQPQGTGHDLQLLLGPFRPEIFYDSLTILVLASWTCLSEKTILPTRLTY